MSRGRHGKFTAIVGKCVKKANRVWQDSVKVRRGGRRSRSMARHVGAQVGAQMGAWIGVVVVNFLARKLR